MPTFEYNFPAIRGVQAGREYYVSMCPLRLIPRIFLFDEDELRPELRAQRILNKNRVPEIARYILGNKKGYTFSSLTASIDGKVRFEPLGEDESETASWGGCASLWTHGSSSTTASTAAPASKRPCGKIPTWRRDNFGRLLRRCRAEARQQMFADLNRYAIRPTRSLSLLYDERDDYSQMAKALVRRVPIFTELTELERSTISNRSLKLFTLSGIYTPPGAFGGRSRGCGGATGRNRRRLLVRSRPANSQLAVGQRPKGEHGRSAARLHPLAYFGPGGSWPGGKHPVKDQYPDDWKPPLVKLRTLDWSRSNSAVWEGRAYERRPALEKDRECSADGQRD